MSCKIWLVVGVVWAILMGITPASAIDSDGDGIVDDLDNCPAVANPDQADSEDSQPAFARWAESAWASSEWSAEDWSAGQAAGPPENPGVCIEMPTAWSPASDANLDEWIELIFRNPVNAEGVHILRSMIRRCVLPRH